MHRDGPSENDGRVAGVEMWADYVCPWCYLALDRVDFLAGEWGMAVTWHPYELHPGTPPGGVSLAPGALARSLLADELLAAGLEIRPRTSMSNSRAALALSAGLRDDPRWPRLHRGLYTAYWVEDRDLGDPCVLENVATRVGIGRDAASEAARHVDVIADSMARAHELGIGAVPGWHFGAGIVLTGAHSRATFDKVTRRLG